MLRCQEIYDAGQLKMEFGQESTSILPFNSPVDGLREWTVMGATSNRCCLVCREPHEWGSDSMRDCQGVYDARIDCMNDPDLPVESREQTLEMLANAKAIDASYEVEASLAEIQAGYASESAEDEFSVTRYFDIETDQQEYNLLEQMDHGVITRGMILEQCGGMTGRIGTYFRLAGHRVSDADFMKYVPKRMKDLGNQMNREFAKQMSRSNAPF